MRSSRTHVVTGFGLKGVTRMIRGPGPGSRRVGALPVLTTRSRPEPSGRRATPKTASDGTRPRVVPVRRWLPERELILTRDGGVAAVDLAHAGQRHRVVMVCRLRLEAAWDHPPGPQPPGQRGPKPEEGPRQRCLTEWAGRRDTPWQKVQVAWSSDRRTAMLVLSRTGLWPRRGHDPVAIRYVLARDPAGEQPDAASFCTNERFPLEEILKDVVQRWSVEVTFERPVLTGGWRRSGSGRTGRSRGRRRCCWACPGG